MPKMPNRRGSVSIRTILALLIVISLLPILSLIVSCCANLKFTYDEVSDEISIIQLRRILLIAYDQDVSRDRIDFKYHNDDYSLRNINNRLVLQPGYQMFINNADEIYFEERNDAIYLCYEKESKEFETPIMAKEGIYIDNFSNTDDELYKDSISHE